MCGIAGIVGLRGNRPQPDRLGAMLAALAHRGPDDSGTYRCGGVALGHARLSIIDIEGGHQPMSIDDGRLWITFNGEIFNYIELRDELIRKGHKFTTRSDTEVILHLYQEQGERCVERLNGQWAFAIWDEPRKRLFLSRDRMGVRPLFYATARDSFLFASEIKALRASGEVDTALDLRALDQIFTFWVTLPPRTAFRNICQLPPAHSLIFEDGELRTWQYWQINHAAESDASPKSEKVLAEDLLALMTDATRIRLRSDVPVGAYLSGGLDSTFITALTKNLVGERLRTFSVGFDDPEFDETPYQQEASAFLKTQHTKVRCTYDSIAEVFPDVVWHAEQPILRAAPAPLYLLSGLVRASGFKVVLTGEGADELFGGYDIFKEAKIRSFCAQSPESRRRLLLLKRLYPYMDGIQRQPAAYLKRFFRVSATDLASPVFSHLPRWDMTAQLKIFFSDEVRAELSDSQVFSDLQASLPAGFDAWQIFNRAEYLETAHLLPGYILSSQGDRMAMAHSVESRYPFLDHRVVEFAARIPATLKMKVLDQKHLLKRAAIGLIPNSIQTRFKQPYRAPGAGSFFGRSNTNVRDWLSPENLNEDRIFNPGAVAALLAKCEQGKIGSVKDDMAFIGILSTQLLMNQFVHRHRVDAVSTATATLPAPQCSGYGTSH